MGLTPIELRRIREWLDRDPVGNAFVIGFLEKRAPTLLVDDIEEPRALVTFSTERGRLLCTADDRKSLPPMLGQLPRGEFHFSAVDLELIPTLEEILEVRPEEPTWLFRLAEEDFRPTQVTTTSPVRSEHAEMIADHWLPDRDAVEYVRSRIESGMTAGIYDQEELVAWDLTHVETDDVVVLGFLHVKEPYRGRGYAKTVTSANLERVFQKGKIPAIHVFETNEISLHFSEKMGFRRLKKQVWGTAIAGEPTDRGPTKPI